MPDILQTSSVHLFLCNPASVNDLGIQLLILLELAVQSSAQHPIFIQKVDLLSINLSFSTFHFSFCVLSLHCFISFNFTQHFPHSYCRQVIYVALYLYNDEAFWAILFSARRNSKTIYITLGQVDTSLYGTAWNKALLLEEGLLSSKFYFSLQRLEKNRFVSLYNESAECKYWWKV